MTRCKRTGKTTTTVSPVKDPASLLVTWEATTLGAPTNWLRRNIISMLLSSETVEEASDFYLALTTTEPTASAAGTEASWSGYARIPLTFERLGDASAWNPDDIVSSTAGEAWSGAVGWELWDGELGGNRWFYGLWTSAPTIASGKTLQIPANKILVSV